MGPGRSDAILGPLKTPVLPDPLLLQCSTSSVDVCVCACVGVGVSYMWKKPDLERRCVRAGLNALGWISRFQRCFMEL